MRRAQAETLGFVLIFALMISMIGIVYATGFQGLQDSRDVEQVNNAGRAFEVLANNFEDITLRGAPSRATEVKLTQAQLTLADPIEVNVSDPSTGFNRTYEVRPLVYDADTGERLVFVQGAIIREGRRGAYLLSESTLLLNDSRTIVPVVQTRWAAGSHRSVGSSSTVLVRAEQSQRVVAHQDGSSGTVWFNVTSPRAEAWQKYLSEKDDVECDGSAGDGTANCWVTTDTVYVTVIQIDVEIEG